MDEIRNIIVHTSRHGLRRLMQNLHNESSDDRFHSLIALHLLEGVDDQTDELLCVTFLIRYVTLDWLGRYTPSKLLTFTQSKVARETYGALSEGSRIFAQRTLTRQLRSAKAPKTITDTRHRRCEQRNNWYLKNFHQKHANSMATSAEKFQQVFATIPSGYNPLRKRQTYDKLLFCAEMIRKHGNKWVWQIEAYLDDPIYNQLLRHYADPHHWRSYEFDFSKPALRNRFNSAVSAKGFANWFNLGRKQDVYEVTRWALEHLHLNPHFISNVAQMTLLEEVNPFLKDEDHRVLTAADLLAPPEKLPRRLTGFTRLSMAQTVCALAHGAITVDQIEDPNLAAIARRAGEYRDGSISADEIKTLLAEYVQIEAVRVRSCYEAAFDLVGSLQRNEVFTETFVKHGGTKMVRPTAHRTTVDTPADIANRMMYFYQHCRKNGLLALEYYLSGTSYRQRYKHEPDVLIQQLLLFVVDGLGKDDFNDICTAFSDLLQRQAEDRATIAAWSLYAWGVKRMTAEAISKVLITCLEEGRPLP